MCDGPTERELLEVRVQAALVAIGSVLGATIAPSERVRIRKQAERSTTYVPEWINDDEALRVYYFTQLASVFDDLLGDH